MVIDQQRISRLEGAYEQVDRRLGDMHQAIEGLRTEMNNRYNGLVMLIVASWVTIMAALITTLVTLFLK